MKQSLLGHEWVIASQVNQSVVIIDPYVEETPFSVHTAEDEVSTVKPLA